MSSFPSIYAQLNFKRLIIARERHTSLNKPTFVLWVNSHYKYWFDCFTNTSNIIGISFESTNSYDDFSEPFLCI